MVSDPSQKPFERPLSVCDQRLCVNIEELLESSQDGFFRDWGNNDPLVLFDQQLAEPNEIIVPPADVEGILFKTW